MTQSALDPAGGPGGGTPSVAELHQRAAAWFGELVGQVADDQWALPTPCADWDVRALVNHITSEALWTPPLLEGRTIDEVGDRFDGDVVGADPARSWDAAASRARAAVDAPGALGGTVHLSFGDTPAAEYVTQLFADHLIHGWDLAQGIGAAATMDPGLVTACARWFDAVEPTYRESGAIGPRPAVDPGADAQTVLLSRFGRSAALAAVQRFNAAFARHDVDAVMAAMTEDCVFEATGPAPDGQRFEGHDAVRRCWEQFFAASPSAQFDTEEEIVAGDRVVVRWTYHWDAGYVRGVDVLRTRDGKVAHKLAYVKG